MQTLYSLPAELTIYSLTSLREEWLGWVSKTAKARKVSQRANKPWQVDASRVDEVDAAGVQLLLALAHSLSTKNRSLQLINPSNPIANACRGLGVANLLAPDDATDSNS